MPTNPVSLVETLTFGFERALGVSKALSLDPLQQELAPLASSIDTEMSVMVARRRQVEIADPWRFGMLLAFLEKRVDVQAIDGKTGEISSASMSRFEVFQVMGFWEGRGYTEWANARTGKGYTTWMNWRRAAQVCLLSEVGLGYIRQAEMTVPAFIEKVPMDKALRAVATIARGKLRRHQLDVLVDKKRPYSCEDMRHALRSTAKEWKEVEQEIDEHEEAWVADGDEKVKVDFDPATRVLQLGRRFNGEWKVSRVAHLPVSPDADVHELQMKLVELAKSEVEGW